MAAFESQISIKNNTNLDLSEQILVDCSLGLYNFMSNYFFLSFFFDRIKKYKKIRSKKSLAKKIAQKNSTKTFRPNDGNLCFFS